MFLAVVAMLSTSCWSVKSETKSKETGAAKGGAKTVVKNLLNDHEWVDLGLPSGTRWATCNVGATRPTETGFFFAWAETTPKERYHDDTYKFYDHGLTKYCDQPRRGKKGFADDLTEIQAEDDAATINWGEGWRLPTHDEANELTDRCSIKQTEINGVWGITFIGPNGNSIFIPFAGDCYEDKCARGENYFGYYWTSTLYTPSGADRHWSWILHLERGANNGPSADTDNRQRAMGLTIRPVCAAPK